MPKLSFVALALAVLAGPVVTHAQSIPPFGPPPSVEIRAELPKLADSLPVFTRRPMAADQLQKTVQEILGASADTRDVRIERAGDALLVVRDEKTRATRAWMDLKTAQAAVYPSLELARDGGSIDDRTLLKQYALPKIEALFSDKLGKAAVGPVRALKHARAYRDGTQQAPRSALLYVSAEHRIDSLASDKGASGAVRVEGPGARALLTFNARGDIVGVSGSFRDVIAEAAAPRAKQDLKEEIVRQLSALDTIKSAQVVDVRLVYYDGGQALIQPAYRFLAMLTPMDATSPLHARFVVGYAPYAQTQEPLPSLTGKVQLPERAPDAAKAAQLSPISVARYVARNADFGFMQDASDFWSALDTGPLGLSTFDAGLFWSEPRLFTQDADTFLRRMELVLIEGHGFAGGFATNGYGDPVYLTDIPEGVTAGVRASHHWLLHSCDVVATPDDQGDWAKPWWTALAAESSVAGYRTPMYINDGAGAAYGRSLSANAPLRSAWLQDVAALEAYADNPYGCQEHLYTAFGRPAVVAACDAPDQGLSRPASTAAAQPQTKCLEAWWLADPASLAKAPPLRTLPSGDAMCADGGPRGVVTRTYTEPCDNAQCQSGSHCGAECQGSECVEWHGC